MDIKLSKAQVSPVIQSGGFVGNVMSNLCKKALTEPAVPWTKDILPKLATKATLSVIDKFKRKISRRKYERYY